MRDTPQISSSCFTTNTTALGGYGQIDNLTGTFVSQDWQDQPAQQQRTHELQQQLIKARTRDFFEKETPMATVTRRLVQVIIVDPNDNIPLDQCLLYNGSPKLTDATDQELFYEIEIKDLLAKHNETRIKVVDKKVKERTEHLEPAKIRDLKMVVVTIASF